MSRGPQYVFLTLLRLTVSAVRPVLSLFFAALGSLPARWADDPDAEASSYFRLPSLFFFVLLEEFNPMAFLHTFWACSLTVKTPAGA